MPMSQRLWAPSTAVASLSVIIRSLAGVSRKLNTFLLIVIILLFALNARLLILFVLHTIHMVLMMSNTLHEW